MLEERNECRSTMKECQVISNDVTAGIELEVEVKSQEESSDIDETAFLRKLKAKTV
jgi:hypothetical protein